MDDNFTNFPEIIVQNFIRFLKKYPNFTFFKGTKTFCPCIIKREVCSYWQPLLKTFSNLKYKRKLSNCQCNAMDIHYYLGLSFIFIG